MSYEEDMKIVEAATEGPWYRNFGDDDRFMCMNWISANKEPSSNIGQYENAGTIAVMFHQGYPDVGCDRDDLNDANAEFIAHFNPLYVKQLIERLLQLEDENAGLIPVEDNGKPLITNEMKAECVGEFSFEIEESCNACASHGADSDCEVCEGEVEYTRTVYVPWDVCKDIYKMMAEVAARGIRK